ncbi:CLUMA_CG002020, isoform A [Clunio marinus]|uniref:CLUMA_CG002020, isoform A n=1 Tax=Clunio marinus TaxID=568069 RepID=A0A1J1HJM4_9DIPT|nr:CLUMA_CG002020, isoform A [Clunio marinus]
MSSASASTNMTPLKRNKRKQQSEDPSLITAKSQRVNQQVVQENSALNDFDLLSFLEKEDEEPNNEYLLMLKKHSKINNHHLRVIKRRRWRRKEKKRLGRHGQKLGKANSCRPKLPTS